MGPLDHFFPGRYLLYSKGPFARLIAESAAAEVNRAGEIRIGSEDPLGMIGYWVSFRRQPEDPGSMVKPMVDPTEFESLFLLTCRSFGLELYSVGPISPRYRPSSRPDACP